jgi:DNA-binding response OmpR family regulator
VIILSIVDDKKQGFSLGAAEYLLKPIDKNLLLRKLKHLERISSIKKVLVVENEPHTVELIGHIIDEAGYKIATAASNADAIRAIQDAKPDLIVLDLTMIDFSGIDLIEYIKTDKEMKNIPLIVITQQHLTADEIRSLDGKIQAILNKGQLSEKELLNELKETLIRLENMPQE